MIKMSKGIENKFNRLVENSDPKELEDKIVKYTNEAFDDVILNGNRDDGLQKIRTSVKFLRDHRYKQPNTFINAWKKINEHLVEILSKALEDTLLSNHEMKIFINVMGVIDLIFLKTINELINSYQEENKESYLKMALDQINELKIMKITLLDNKIFPEALNELKKKSKDDPEFDEKLHEEFIKDIKKDIKDYKAKSDKKNNIKKRLINSLNRLKRCL